MMNMNNDKMFVCDQCVYKTNQKNNLNRHKKMVHNNIKDFKCDFELCEFISSRKDDLNQHIKAVHNKDQGF